MFKSLHAWDLVEDIKKAFRLLRAACASGDAGNIAFKSET
jgi:hypothetical protein